MPKIHCTATGIVWDFDGTILDSFKTQAAVLTEVLQRHGLPKPTRETFVKNYHGRLIDSIQAISGTEGAVLQAIYEDFIQSEERHYEHPEDLYFADAIDLLKRNHAAGLKQIIASNRPHHNDKRLGSPRNLAERPPLAGLIDAVVSGDDNDFHKPDARILDAAERRFGLARSKLLVIGDQYVDIELAYNLGAQMILVLRNGEALPHLEKLPNNWQANVHIVKSLRDVLITKS